ASEVAGRSASSNCDHEGACMPTSLDVRDLRRQLGIARPAVDGVSFHVPTGEIVVLLGPSGCGKTTTLRCVAGLEYSTSGRISIGGRRGSSSAHEGSLLTRRCTLR